MRLIHIMAPAALEGDVNILKLFIASVPWFMKQCMQCLQTTRKSAGCWRNAVRTTVNVSAPTYLYRRHFNGSFVVQQLGSSACLYLTFRQRMAVPLHRTTTPVSATSARAVTTPAFGTSPTTPLLQQKYQQPTTTSTTA